MPARRYHRLIGPRKPTWKAVPLAMMAMIAGILVDNLPKLVAGR
jgi:hypothetical protein